MDQRLRRPVDAEVGAQVETRRITVEEQARHVSGITAARAEIRLPRMPLVAAEEERPQEAATGAVEAPVRLQARAAPDSRHPLADRRSHMVEAVVAALAHRRRAQPEAQVEAELEVEHRPRRQVERQTRAAEAVANGQRPQRQVPVAPVL